MVISFSASSTFLKWINLIRSYRTFTEQNIYKC
nr:MAG TPA: hypothetical protein [Caudoviricetes sp.]